MTPLLPDPVPLDPPPGDPRALDDLTGRLRRAAELLGELAEQLSGAATGATPSWSGRDAVAATTQVGRVGGLVREAAEALLHAGGRLARHREVLADARRRFASLRAAQEDDYGAAAARLGGVVDPASAGSAAAFAELHRAESARRRVAAGIRAEVEDDAAATAVVLAGCSAIAGGGGRAGDRDGMFRHLARVLPGWHELELVRRGEEFVAAFTGRGDEFSREEAARDLLPWAGDGRVAAAVLTGLGADGFRDVLQQLGDGSLSAGSALARVLAAVLGAPVPPADAEEVTRVRDGRHVDPTDHRTLDDDLVALGMGVVLAAGRGDRRAGPPPATVREWGRQIVARERALGSERIVDRIRLQASYARPTDPLQEVAARLGEAGDPAPAAGLLRARPTWSHLLARPWDDGGAAFAALVERAGEAAQGDTAVRAGLRALATGLGDDGDPAHWTVDRATAAVIAPSLASAVTAHPDVLVRALDAAAGKGGQSPQLLRGLGYLSTESAAVLDRGVDETVAGLTGGAGTVAPGPAVAVVAGYPAVREYGQRLAHALDEFAAQELGRSRMLVTDVVKELTGPVGTAVVGVGSVLGDFDGTWEASSDRGERFPVEDAVRAAGGAATAEAAYRDVAALLGTPTPPAPPPTDRVGLVRDVLPVPVRGFVGELVERSTDAVKELLDDRPDPADGAD